MHRVADLSASPSYQGDNLFVDTAPARRLSQHLRSSIHADASDLDGLEARLVDLRHDRDFRRARKGSGPTYSKAATRAQVLEARDALVAGLETFQVRADADLAARLHGELIACVGRYERLKAREGALDFLDLLLQARDLVRRDRAVRAHFQQRFRRLFVDEFQDTDPLQAEILILLAADAADETDWTRVQPVPGKLFVVGDPKQSIYRFRRADVDVYARVCARLEACGGARVELRRSFRAVPNLQRAVNAAFSPIMDGDPETLQARDMPLEPVRPPIAGQPSVVALPVPRPYGHRYVSAREIERSLPDAVGAYVEWLVRESGWQVTERRDPGRLVPVQPRHVCILFRRFVSFGEDITRPYVEALEARGIRHLLVEDVPSTNARRSRRCGRRSWPSSGPTISCPCSPRCAEPCSRSATKISSSTSIWVDASIRSGSCEAVPAHLEPIGNALADAGAPAPAPQPAAGRRYGHGAPRSHAGARRLRPAARR